MMMIRIVVIFVRTEMVMVKMVRLMETEKMNKAVKI